MAFKLHHKDTNEVLAEVLASSLEGIDLSRRDLRGVMLNGQNMHGLNFAGSDLSEAQLSFSNLTGANFSNANLTDALLTGCNVTSARFDDADLGGAHLNGARLNGSSLLRTNLADCKFVAANLNDVLLREADLRRTQFNRTSLSNADFTRSILLETNFIDCEKLDQAVGLDSTRFLGSVVVDLRTLRACAAELPESFLYGAGYTIEEVALLRDLYAAPVRQVACSIGYSFEDREFASKLSLRLHGDNVCARLSAQHDITDRDWEDLADDVLSAQNVLIVIVSEDSIVDEFVLDAVNRVLIRQQQRGGRRLFVVSVDNCLSESILSTSGLRPRSGPQGKNILTALAEQEKFDFTTETGSNEFDTSYAALLYAIKHRE